MKNERKSKKQLVDELEEMRQRVADAKATETACKQVEKSLRESEERYSLLFNEMLTGLSLHEIILDDNGKPVDYRFLDVNPAFEKHTGLKKEDIVGKTVLEVLPGTEPIWIETSGKVALSGEPMHFESYSSEIGKYYEVLTFCPKKGQFATLSTDITEHRKIEEALRESEEKYRILVENSADCICHIDLDGKYIYMNPGGVLLNELDSLDELSGRDCTTGIKGEYIDSMHNALEMARQGETTSLEYESINAKGKNLWWESIVGPINRGKGNVTGIIRISRNVTERKRLEERLQIRQRMDSLGTLTAGVAHDFHNLLTGVLMNIELITDKGENLTEAQKGMADQAITQCLRATSLIKQFQKLSKAPSIEKKHVDVYEIASEVFSLLYRTTDKLIEKRIDFGKGEYFVFMNPTDLSQVLLNLGTNAVQAIEQRGVQPGDYVRISCGEREMPGTDETGLPEGKYISLRFEDNGEGMSDEVAKRAFDPMFTTRDMGTQKGQGLGLAMVYNIVTNVYGGHVSIESEEGVGTTFHISLPRDEQHEQVGEKVEKTEIKGGNETVLVVDDEEIIRNLVGMILRQHGYRVLTAVDGLEALKVYRENSDDIDVVLLDLIMPKMTGSEVMRDILEKDPEAKVIVFSGQSEESLVCESFSRAKGAIPKPVKTKDLLLTLRKALDNKK